MGASGARPPAAHLLKEAVDADEQGHVGVGVDGQTPVLEVDREGVVDAGAVVYAVAGQADLRLPLPGLGIRNRQPEHRVREPCEFVAACGGHGLAGLDRKPDRHCYVAHARAPSTFGVAVAVAASTVAATSAVAPASTVSTVSAADSLPCSILTCAMSAALKNG